MNQLRNAIIVCQDGESAKAALKWLDTQDVAWWGGSKPSDRSHGTSTGSIYRVDGAGKITFGASVAAYPGYTVIDVERVSSFKFVERVEAEIIHKGRKYRLAEESE